MASLLIPLSRLGLGISQYRNLFEFATAECCRELKIAVKRDAVAPGLWSRNGHLAYFGGAVKSWISLHGMALNISTDSRLLALTHTNDQQIPAVSMRSQRLEPVRMARVRELWMRHLAVAFGYELSDVSTGHPLLKRAVPSGIRNSEREARIASVPEL